MQQGTFSEDKLKTLAPPELLTALGEPHEIFSLSGKELKNDDAQKKLCQTLESLLQNPVSQKTETKNLFSGDELENDLSSDTGVKFLLQIINNPTVQFLQNINTIAQCSYPSKKIHALIKAKLLQQLHKNRLKELMVIAATEENLAIESDSCESETKILQLLVAEKCKDKIAEEDKQEKSETSPMGHCLVSAWQELSTIKEPQLAICNLAFACFAAYAEKKKDEDFSNGYHFFVRDTLPKSRAYQTNYYVLSLKYYELYFKTAKEFIPVPITNPDLFASKLTEIMGKSPRYKCLTTDQVQDLITLNTGHIPCLRINLLDVIAVIIDVTKDQAPSFSQHFAKLLDPSRSDDMQITAIQKAYEEFAAYLAKISIENAKLAAMIKLFKKSLDEITELPLPEMHDPVISVPSTPSPSAVVEEEKPKRKLFCVIQ